MVNPSGNPTVRMNLFQKNEVTNANGYDGIVTLVSEKDIKIGQREVP